MFAKFFSYFIPINVHKKNSAISNTLEVTWNNGELVLDSKTLIIHMEVCNEY